MNNTDKQNDFEYAYESDGEEEKREKKIRKTISFTPLSLLSPLSDEEDFNTEDIISERIREHKAELHEKHKGICKDCNLPCILITLEKGERVCQDCVTERFERIRQELEVWE